LRWVADFGGKEDGKGWLLSGKKAFQAIVHHDWKEVAQSWDILKG